MMKLFKSRLFLGVICLLLAAGIAFLILPRVYSAKANTTTVLKLKRDVQVGTVIEAGMVSSVEVGGYGLPDTVVRDEADAIGMVASERMYSGEYLSSFRLLTEEEYKKYADAQTLGLDAGSCLVTIQLPTTSAGVASILRSGHFVDVQEWVETEFDGVTVQNALSGLYVYDVLNTNLESLSNLDAKQTASEEDNSSDLDFKPAYIVFRCTEEQAQTLIRLERAKSLHLTLERSGG